ncbi:MAG: cbb3-type cytochrome c oxidase subunit II [Verrucomicrobiae bacterium]|nr:cbb3-type cytochrome c oxidase subunit II [Verrucomicrobiae bacterium]
MFLFLLTGSGLVALSRFGHPPVAEGDPVLAGRQVYISEGCINCHSQYARPESTDLVSSGPRSDLNYSLGGPVLIGNRRQGPDLSNVGNRRSAEWNRQHLIDPRTTSPESRMPSYAFLFREGNSEKGEALLDYLGSLTAENPENWWSTVYYWKPDAAEPGNPDTGRRLFQQNCAQCHGSDARGPDNNELSFAILPIDLVDGTYRFAPRSMDPEMRDMRIAQLIKYGQPGTSMPGHEYLTDQNVVDLLSYLKLTTH